MSVYVGVVLRQCQIGVMLPTRFVSGRHTLEGHSAVVEILRPRFHLVVVLFNRDGDVWPLRGCGNLGVRPLGEPRRVRLDLRGLTGKVLESRRVNELFAREYGWQECLEGGSDVAGEIERCIDGPDSIGLDHFKGGDTRIVDLIELIACEREIDLGDLVSRHIVDAAKRRNPQLIGRSRVRAAIKVRHPTKEMRLIEILRIDRSGDETPEKRPKRAQQSFHFVKNLRKRAKRGTDSVPETSGISGSYTSPRFSTIDFGLSTNKACAIFSPTSSTTRRRAA